jgi:hypothetical protein
VTVARALSPLGWLVFLLVSGSVAAQQSTPSPTAPAQPAQPAAEWLAKWVIDVHAGPSFDRQQAAGRASLPLTGNLEQGLVSASTFYFGAGTTLFNQSRQSTPITGLDAMLGSMWAERPRGLAVGARVERTISRRWALEVASDYSRGNLQFTGAGMSALEASRSSYESALRQTLALSQETSTAGSTLTLVDRQLATRLTVTGAFVARLRQTGRTIPYLVAGGGVMFNHGSALNALLDGHYTLGSGSYLEGSDRVWIRYDEDAHSIVGLGGAGLRQSLSRHFGIRFDVRAHVYQNSGLSLVDVTPAHFAGSVGPSLPIFNINALQFSAVRPLNGTTLSGATTFTGSGLRIQTVATAGLTIHF